MCVDVGHVSLAEARAMQSALHRKHSSIAVWRWPADMACVPRGTKATHLGEDGC
jgi:hypothetical protein